MGNKNGKTKLIGIQALALAIVGILALLSGDSLGQNSVVLLYLITIVLTLPSLLSKVLLRRGFLGIGTVAMFLYYPAFYLSAFALQRIASLNTQDLYGWFMLFNILLWNLLAALFILRLDPKQFKQFTSRSLFILGFGMLIVLILVVALRQPNSVVAFDYLQHQAAINNMIKGDTLCLVPNSCSNLFIQLGYTSFYHSIIMSITGLAGVDITTAFYLIDLVWPLLGLCVIYSFFKNSIKQEGWALIGALLSLMVFINGAYEFVFLIPQTLTIYFFLNLINDSSSLSWRKLLIGGLLLLLGHFVIGAFLIGLLVIYKLYFNWQFEQRGVRRALLVFIVLGAIFSIILSITGFSFEQAFQANELEVVGGPTNLTFWPGFIALLNILGFAALLMISAIIFLFRTKFQVKYVVLIWMLFSLSVYFIGPTYANKFLLGFGIYSFLIITWWLSHIEWKSVTLLISLGLITLTLIFTYNLNYHEYLKFYRQSDGRESVITKTDPAIINYLKENNPNCVVLSDPYTQIIITAYAGTETAKAQYLKPSSRQVLFELAKNPSSDNLEALFNIPELANSSSVCLLFTSRIAESLAVDHTFWLNNIYSLPNDNFYDLGDTHNLRAILLQYGSEILLENQNFILFSSLVI